MSSAVPAWDLAFVPTYTLTALRAWRFPGGSKSFSVRSVLAVRARGRLRMIFAAFWLMKCGFLAVASVIAVQGGEITMSVDHIWMKPKRGFERQDSSV